MSTDSPSPNAIQHRLTHFISAFLFSLIINTSGCSSHARLSEGLETRTIAGDGFIHKLMYTPAIYDSDTLHIYIEGDGRPWLGGRTVASDPTPYMPYALRLMRLDDTPAIYLGRPCYFNTADPNCHSRYWTGARYSAQVIDSMHTALLRLVNIDTYQQVTLIGYSGGGVIAVLLSERLQRSTTTVTLSANLDTSMWTDVHGYLPLSGSINPRSTYSNPARVRHQHYAGGRDRVVPPRVTHSFTEHFGLPLRVISDYDHSCCWHRRWPELLNSALSPAAEPDA